MIDEKLLKKKYRGLGLCAVSDADLRDAHCDGVDLLVRFAGKKRLLRGSSEPIAWLQDNVATMTRDEHGTREVVALREDGTLRPWPISLREAALFVTEKSYQAALLPVEIAPAVPEQPALVPLTDETWVPGAKVRCLVKARELMALNIPEESAYYITSNACTCCSRAGVVLVPGPLGGYAGYWVATANYFALVPEENK